MENSFGEKKNMSLEAQPKPYLRKEDTFLHVLCDLNEAVENFIRKYESQYAVSIIDYELQKENVQGAYFIAGVLRLNYNFQKYSGEQASSSVILKVPQLGALRDYAENLFLYTKEKYVYEEVIPVMYESWTRAKAVPEFYGSTDMGVLVLENLGESQFYQLKNGGLLDVSTCRIVLEALAQFHALSLKHLQTIRPRLDSLTAEDKSVSEWEQRVYPAVVRKLKKYVLPACSEYLRLAFDQFLDNLNDFFRMDLASKENGFNVLLHGDSHYYNVMLKNDDSGRVCECKLIDFQWSRRGSPISDIMQFLTTSLAPDLFGMHYEMLFTSYIQAVQNAMDEVDMSVPFTYSLGELLSDFEKSKTYYMYQVTCLVPIFWSGQSDFRAADLEDNVDHVLKSPEYFSFFTGWAKFLFPAQNACSAAYRSPF